MNREVIFAETLKTLLRTAKEQGGYVLREQLEETFRELSLEKEQLALVEDYLLKHNVGIDEPLFAEEALSGEKTDDLAGYMESLSPFLEVSQGEKEAVTLSAMAGDRQAQERLLTLYLPDVVEVAKLYTGQGVFLEDLIGEGNLAVATGVTMLGCLEHPSEVQGMLGKMMMDAMEQLIAYNLEEERKDRKVLENVNEVTDRARELSEELQKKVTVEELSKETGLGVEAIKEAIRMSGGNIPYISA